MYNEYKAKQWMDQVKWATGGSERQTQTTKRSELKCDELLGGQESVMKDVWCMGVCVYECVYGWYATRWDVRRGRN